MPRLMSPLRPRYMRKPPEGSTEAFTAASVQPAQAAEQPAEPEYPETVQVSEGTFRQVRDDSLVLLSQGIEHRLVRSEEGPFQIFIVPEMESAAKTQLELYHKENPPKEENPPIPLSFSLQPLWVLLAPILVTLLQFTDKINLHSEGVSDAAKVLKGEWWRSLTAQTLHGDARHLASNLLCGYIVMNMITFRIPLLRLVPFIAVAAAVANLCVSATVQTDFRSLGFSTFVFAAIGCLSVIEFRLMPKESHGMLRRFAPLCGAASLAVFLGLGENADILGHAYGFVAGLFCGFIPKKKSLRWGTPLSSADGVGLLMYYGLYLLAWKLALG
ncbi:MAG: rhomboid family intramembrane serine protease [Fibrobacter sp.]|nr:rhomboid family intramembrane serine protease [Fibrobacter sp.]MBR3852363.1 rhomboid family intramembrane serine protease [Fibrobacter sp.]